AVNGLVVSGAGASSSAIRGLEVVRFTGEGIHVENANDVAITGNYIGTDGTADLGNGGLGGIAVVGNSARTHIGGTAAGEGNLISGNGRGITLNGANVTDSVIEGNFVGTNAAGTATISPGTQEGILISAAPRTIIGGTAPGAGNLISGNALGIQ